MLRKSYTKKTKQQCIRLWILSCIWIIIVILVWTQGYFGNWILLNASPHFLPIDLEDGFFVTKIAVETQPIIPQRGLRLSVSPQKLKDTLRESNPLLWMIPPGVVSDEVVIHGKWVPEKASAEYSLPITINCNEASGESIRVVFRYPFTDLNSLLKVEMAEDWRDEDEYFLGTYTKDQRIWFDSISIKSKTDKPRLPDSPILLNVNASGRLRYKVEDGLIGARITAKIRELSGVVELIPEEHTKGVGFKYSCSIDKLDISVNNMAPWLEDKLADDLKESIERSLNKRKRRREFAQMRIPYWVPLDNDIDIELTE